MKKDFKNLVTIGMLLFISTTMYKVNEPPAPEPVAAVETKTIYLHTSEEWRTDNAWFAAWVWSNETDGTFFKLDKTAENEEIYSVNLPITPYDHIIFTRMNPESSTLSWDYRWNQTSDLELDLTSKNDTYVLIPMMMGENEHGDGKGQIIGSWTASGPVEVPDEPDPETNIDPSVYTIYYWRNDGKHAQYDLWLWSPGEGGKAFGFKGSKDVGGKSWRYTEIPSTDFRDSQYLNLIVKRGDWEEQTPDMEVDVTNYERVMDGETPRRNFFLVDMETTVYATADDAIGEKVLKAEFSKENEVTITTYHAPASYEFLIDGVVNKTSAVTTTEKDYKHVFSFAIANNVDVIKAYQIKVTFKSGVVKEKQVTIEGLYNTSFFINNLTYDGSDLGVTYTPQQTKFKVWAPTSTDLKINLYENGTPVSVDKVKGSDVIKETLPMTRGEKGTWEASKSGDLHNLYYTLVSTNASGTVELTDPYAKASGVNGIRGMIVDFSKTNPTGWENVNYSVKKPTEIIPYELHVSDLTADASWNGTEAYRKNFLGLIQRGTTYQKNEKAVKTGFDHILELGVNAVQILPFYDQQNDETNMEFNWGYNPQNYNVLEGGYSSDPHNGLVRINEFKRVVQAYAAHDIRIIMDVVYNHVASISQHSFTKLVPGYYFRYDSAGGPDNSSGVGNVTASERIMMERYMRDSTAFWASEYKIGGFRFDLMGLHTMKAMNTLTTNLKSIRDDIVVYGEPWNMDHTGLSDLAIQNNIHRMQHVGAFSDAGRDAIKGGSWANEARPGWVQVSGQDVDKVVDATMGKIAGTGNVNPSQVVNYVSVHDNYTIYDHLKTASRLKGFNFDEGRIRAQALQAEAISLTSQGISFIHAGSELLRSKPLEGGSAGYYDHNSYKSSYAVNSIKWATKWENLDYFNSYRQLIALKRYSQAFNYSTRQLVDANSGAYKIANNFIKLTYKDASDNYTIHHYGAGTARQTITDLKGREVVLDTSGTLKRGEKLTDRVSLAVNTTLITRNVRERGANDLTWPAMTAYVDPPTVDPVDPIDPVDPVDPLDPVEPTDPETEDKPGLSTGAIIGISVGGGSVTIGGIALLLFKLLRKKPV